MRPKRIGINASMRPAFDSLSSSIGSRRTFAGFEVSQVDPALGANITGWNRLPDLVAAWRSDGEWGHVKAAGIVRQVGYQTTGTPGGKPSGMLTGYALNLSGALRAGARDSFNWQVVGGRAIASSMNNGGVDLAPGGDLKSLTVPSLGWLAYVNRWWPNGWSSALGFS